MSTLKKAIAVLAFLGTALSLADTASFCPYKREVGFKCNDSTGAVLGSKGARFNFDPWQYSYGHEDTCRLWNWVQQSSDWHYPPLEEWSANVEDALREHVDEDTIYKFFKMAPLPPSIKADRRDRSVPKCQVANAAESNQISAQLHYFNFRDLPRGLLENLVHFCLAFEVGTTPAERFVNQISGAFIVPLGETNLVFVGRLDVPPESMEMVPPENKMPGPDVRVTFFAAGSCPVTQSPRQCVQGMLGKRTEPIEYGFDNGKPLTLATVPFGTGVDALFRWRGGFSAPAKVQLNVDAEGRTTFTLPTEGKKTKNLGFEVRDGRFSLRTSTLTCNPLASAEEPLNLKFTAFSGPLTKLFSEINIYRPRDFPTNYAIALPKAEKRCEKGKSVSEWMAETANMGGHYLNHAADADGLYREIAFRYFLFKNDYVNLRKISGKEFADFFRKKVETEMLPVDDPREDRAMSFALDGTDKADEIAVFNKAIDIDEFKATEVWFYRQEREIATEDSTFKSRVVIVHQGSPEDIYQKSVIQRVETLFTSCMSEREQKNQFIATLYALFNAKVLEDGSDPVGRVFMASVCQHVFLKELSRPRLLKQVEVDAMTMGFPEFKSKYLAVVN